MKKIEIFLFHKVYLGVSWAKVGQTLKVSRICKEQDKSTYLCKLQLFINNDQKSNFKFFGETFLGRIFMKN